MRHEFNDIGLIAFGGLIVFIGLIVEIILFYNQMVNPFSMYIIPTIMTIGIMLIFVGFNAD